MHREIKEMLIGSGIIILLGIGIGIIAWPPLGLFVDRYFFSYLRPGAAVGHLLKQIGTQPETVSDSPRRGVQG
ncbi:hypothetical protein [Bradyrhizobium sp. BWC-3-1]|uniref:hypothetical protein n=1 Tax=Bradyrhizobium sp. BWC-3-1 TaxID=3080012 RepID=UPI00293E2796|nr:hypothetical protein [Bradyrhizobium sp. BWC-3-1]WOH55342.1 hypothetical protein RX329_23830 [Bradyrhizobium sp. BWC-3-1]